MTQREQEKARRDAEQKAELERALAPYVSGVLSRTQRFDRVHELKTWCEFFEAVVDGRKTFEVRRNDRDFLVGDVLLLREWAHTDETYTGRSARRVVTYVLRGPAFGIEAGYAVLGIGPE